MTNFSDQLFSFKSINMQPLLSKCALTILSLSYYILSMFLMNHSQLINKFLRMIQ